MAVYYLGPEASAPNVPSAFNKLKPTIITSPTPSFTTKDILCDSPIALIVSVTFRIAGQNEETWAFTEGSSGLTEPRINYIPVNLVSTCCRRV